MTVDEEQVQVSTIATGRFADNILSEIVAAEMHFEDQFRGASLTNESGTGCSSGSSTGTENTDDSFGC